MSDAIYTNNNYEVHVNDAGDGYNIVNINTGVIDGTAGSEPEAKHRATELNVALVHNTHEWMEKRARERAAQEIGLVQNPTVQ